MIDIDKLTKVYRMGEVEVHALRGVSLHIERGEFVSIMGPSGSGKSTLMNLLGCLDSPSGGSYRLNDRDVSKLGDRQLAHIRNREIGFVFQSYNLLARMSAERQVELPLIYAGVGAADRRRRAREALETVGLGDRLKHSPDELSGGEQQRVAIARALATEPSLILADEPTGNLDSHTGQEVLHLLQELNDRGMSVIVVTHDAQAADFGKRIIRLRDGLVERDEPVNRTLTPGVPNEVAVAATTRRDL
jgi:putative ABC transport system ATP-binding protein